MKKIIQIDSTAPEPSLLLHTANILQNGGVVAFPTDTCYGLAVNPFDPSAVTRLFKIKGREATKPIILLIAQLSMLDTLVKTPSPLAKAVIQEFWPGPLTLIFQKKAVLPDLLTAGQPTIGIRLPKAIIPLKLILEAGFPLTATSANRSGQPPAVSALEIEDTLGNDLDLILDSGTCDSTPSTVLDLTGPDPNILRKGKIPSDLLENFFTKKSSG